MPEMKKTRQQVEALHFHETVSKKVGILVHDHQMLANGRMVIRLNFENGKIQDLTYDTRGLLILASECRYAEEGVTV